MYPLVPRLAISALLALGASVFAAPVQLAGSAPYAGGLNGVESDPGTLLPAYERGFTAPANSTLDKIVWWGYRLNDQSGGADDSFEVAIDGQIKTGTLAVETDGRLQKYTLDISDEALTGKTLSILNDGAFEWYWQGTSATAYPDTGFDVAYSLLGTTGGGNVPEPGTLALVGLAGWALASSRRRRSA